MLLTGQPLQAATEVSSQSKANSDGTGDRAQIIAQAPPESPAQPPLVPEPEVTIEDNGSSNPDILQPTTPAAPVLPRAVAPPVGDMAISNINALSDRIDLGTSILVPRLVLRQAPAREVLAVLARYAGLNLVFIDSQEEQAAEKAVSLDLENEPVQEVFNSVLMISGLKANRQGNTIFVGSKLPQEARNLVSRTLRLNQVKSVNAATYLATQGAEYQRLVSQTEDIVDSLTQRVIGRREVPPTLEALSVEPTEGSTAPLLLSGLMVAADDRLNSITLIGEPRQVEIATSLLTQLDARRRQVAVNVKVVDVNLTNIEDFNTSFSFGVDDTFFFQDGGAAILNFGNTLPNDSTSAFSGLPNTNIADLPKRFLLQLQAQIQNGNAKILTDPTLVVQEGQEATVKLTQKVLESVQTEVDPLSGVRTVTPVLADSGLTLAVNIDKIDDNGFVNLSVSPTVAAPGATVEFDSGGGTNNVLTLLNRREVTSGLIRLRDDQTLVLSGVIQETDRTTVSKVPILGDIPLLGALFRSTNVQTDRNEVIILLTPQIIEDTSGSQFGFNYTPGPATSDILKKNDFPAQPQP